MTTKRPPLDFDAIKIASNGNWVNTIFPAVGIRLTGTPNKAQPCPICGGKDRFRCDDKQGKGTWICNQCGAGDGFKLVELYTSTTDSYDLMKLIGGILGVSATTSITPEQREKWKAEQVAKEAAEAEAKMKAQTAVAKQALERWNKASMTGHSDYLTRKQVMPFECRFEGNTLLIPVLTLQAGNQVLRNIQSITNDGKKLFMTGGQVAGCYCRIGLQPQFDNPSHVIICEGWATGASIYMALNQSIPVYVAFNAHNLLPVGRSVRAMHPNTRIIFCADNDVATGEKTGKNVGVESANEAAKAVKGEVIIPDFSAINNSNKAVA